MVFFTTPLPGRGSRIGFEAEAEGGEPEEGGGSERRDLSTLSVGSFAAARRAAREREPGAFLEEEGREDSVVEVSKER